MNALELEKWLEHDEARTRAARAQRLKLLVEEFGQEGPRWFFGEQALMSFEEARLAYLHGLFSSCLIMCQVCMEHLLFGQLYAASDSDVEGAGFKEILLKARNANLITSDEYDLFERLRISRNPYVHGRPPLARDSLTMRAITSGTTVDEVLISDAADAIKGLLRICNRPPILVS